MPGNTRRNPTVFPYRGKFRVQYQDLLGNQRTITAETKEDAYLKLAMITGISTRGYLNLPASQIPRFDNWVRGWLDSKARELSPTTIWGYESSTRNFLNPALGGFRIDRITSQHIRQLYDYLQARHSLKNGTIRKLHSLLRGVFRTAVDGGLLLRSPMDSVKPPRLSLEAPDIFTEDEIQQIWQRVEQLEPRAQLRWWLALKLGLRQGEALGLKFTDFDLARLEVRIQRTVNSLPGRGVVELPLKSESSRRVLPIDGQIRLLLEELKTTEPPRAFVFEGRGTSPLDATADLRAWKALLAQAGVRTLKLHAARHSVASRLIQQGVSARSVQMLLGHSSPAYTLATYVHPDISQLRQLIQPNEGASSARDLEALRETLD